MKLLEVIDVSYKSKKIKLVETAGLSRPDGIVQVADNRFLLVINDFNNSGQQRIYGFPSSQAAQDALDQYTDPSVTASQFERNNRSNLRNSNWRRATDVVSQEDFERRSRTSPFLQRLTQGRIFGAFTGLLRFAGVAMTVYYGILSDAADIMDDDSLTADEKQERIDILYGLLVVEVTAMLLIIFRTSRILNRAITSLKTTVRTMQAAAGFSIVGTVPAIISFIASEAAFWAIGYALAHSGVQRALADFLAGTFVGNVFGYAGQSLNSAAAALAEATNDRFGSRNLQRWLGFPDADTTNQIRSAAYGSSEWAKLVMGAIMYPPQADPLIVPYIPSERREALLAEKLNTSIAEIESLDAEDTEQSNAPTETLPNDSAADVAQDDAVRSTPRPETPAERSARTREQSLRTDYSNPNYTRAQPFAGPR